MTESNNLKYLSLLESEIYNAVTDSLKKENRLITDHHLEQAQPLIDLKNALTNGQEFHKDLLKIIKTNYTDLGCKILKGRLKKALCHLCNSKGSVLLDNLNFAMAYSEVLEQEKVNKISMTDEEYARETVSEDLFCGISILISSIPNDRMTVNYESSITRLVDLFTSVNKLESDIYSKARSLNTENIDLGNIGRTLETVLSRLKSKTVVEPKDFINEYIKVIETDQTFDLN